MMSNRSEKVRKDMLKQKKIITYGSDFAGLSTMGIALHKLQDKSGCSGIQLCHKFASDKKRASKKFIEVKDPAEQWDSDILKRNIGELKKTIKPGTLSLYSFTSPCQGLSLAGLMRGLEDDRTTLFLSAIRVISELNPKAFVSENVSTLARVGRFKPILAYAVKKLQTAGSAGYNVTLKIINTRRFLPQNRERIYIVGIRKDVQRTLTKGVEVFPAEFPSSQVPIKKLVKPLSDSLWKPHPPKSQHLEYNNVIRAYKESGMNPFIEPLIIDFKASESFMSWRHAEAPTITHTRASQFGYWSSVKGGPLSIDDMAALQGFSVTDLHTEPKIKDRALAGMLGNAQSLPVLMWLLPNVLWNAQLITWDEYLAMKDVKIV